MRIRVTQRAYQDMVGCCDSSLFEKGKSVPNTARDDHIGLDDFAYDAGYAAWTYRDGFEGPMAVYNYNELWVRLGKEYEQLPNLDEHHFLDLVTHIPYAAKHNVFIAVSKKHQSGGWEAYLNCYRHDGSTWKLSKRFSGADAGRPIQFVHDDDHLVVLQNRALALLNLETLALETVYESADPYPVNCHPTRESGFIGCVLNSAQKAEAPSFLLLDEAYQPHRFNKGVNTSSLAIAKETLPLRVDNGMVEIVFEATE